MSYMEESNLGFEKTSNASVEDYFALLKPNVMRLVVFTAFVGMILAPGSIHPYFGFIAILCIAVGAGAAGALNMWYDSDIDAIMSRTQNRPIPAGRVSRDEALIFGIILSVFSVMTLGLVTNWFAAGLLAFTIFFYVVIYSMWLKRSTPYNIVIGGASGALPPIVGWAAVSGTITLESIILFTIIFVWTPPHFWALNLYKKGDYEAAKIPMLPNVAGEDETRKQILLYSILLAPVGALPWAIGMASWVYGVPALLAGAAFIYYAAKVYRVRPDGVTKLRDTAAKKQARGLFIFSLYYLTGLFALLLIDHLVALVGWV